MIQVRYVASVRFGDLQPQLLFGLWVAAQVYAKHGAVEMWITSLDDSRHSRGSLHYRGLAVDLRTRSLPGGSLGRVAQEIAAELGRRLAPGFDVVLEADHLHLEYDPT